MYFNISTHVRISVRTCLIQSSQFREIFSFVKLDSLFSWLTSILSRRCPKLGIFHQTSKNCIAKSLLKAQIEIVAKIVLPDFFTEVGHEKAVRVGNAFEHERVL